MEVCENHRCGYLNGEDKLTSTRSSVSCAKFGNGKLRYSWLVGILIDLEFEQVPKSVKILVRWDL